MKMSEFDKSIVVTFEHRPDPLTYAMLGLAGETGEVVDAYKKAMRMVAPDEVPKTCWRNQLLDELGDVLWYLTKVVHELDSDLETVARMNMRKLAQRRREGKGSTNAGTTG